MVAAKGPPLYAGLSPGAGDHLKTLDSCTATGFCCGRPRKSLGMSSPRSRTPAEPFVSCWAASACRSLHEQTALHDEALCCCSLCLLLAGRCSLFAGSLMSCWLKAKTCCACCCGAAVPHAAFMLPCCTALCLAARVRPIVCVYVLKAEVEKSQSGQSESLRLLFEFDEEDLYSKMTTSSSPGARLARN